MILDCNNKSVRLTGRWHIEEERATTTAPGGMIECAFKGKSAVLMFKMENMKYPFPHLWISVDGGAKIETALDSYLRVEAKDEGEHYVRIIFKSSIEQQHRWYHPLVAKVIFEGVEAEGGAALYEDTRKTIEFIGDSITEGVLIDWEKMAIKHDETQNRVFQDDVTATYAYLTAMNLNLKPIIMGYGAVGLTKSGCGSVPKAIDSYPNYFDGTPMEPVGADITVINHGANDVGSGVEKYLAAYDEFLKLVRKRNPNTKIVVLGAFCGFAADELAEMVEKFNKENDDEVVYIRTKGWIPVEPLHPERDGHEIVANHLTEELKKLL